MVALGSEPFRRATARNSAHVIVCGNEKGGSGKSTTAMHIAVALAQAGHRVATVDLDGRQLSLTHYVENRRRWARKSGLDLAIPHHVHVPPARRELTADAEAEEFRLLADGIAGVDREFDFVVIDTPGADTFLSRLAHRMADTLVTPMNDSFVDLDVLAQVDPIEHTFAAVSQYALSVRDARRERRTTDGAVIDWIVVRNRLAPISSRNERKVDASLRKLSMQLGFRVADGVGERTVFREFFPLGLTALDDIAQHALSVQPSLSHLAARREVRQLVGALRLPTDEAGRQRSATRRAHAEALSRPIALPDIFVR